MEYSEKPMSFKIPPPNLKLKYLKVDMIRLSVLNKFISKNKYLSLLNKTITENRTIING
jgi:hypothetical protein